MKATVKKENPGHLWDNSVQDIWLSFFPTFCNLVDFLWLLLGNSSFRNWWRQNTLGKNFVYCSWIYFTITKTMNKLFSTKNGIFLSLVGPSVTGNSQLIYNWLKNGDIKPKSVKICYFYQHSQSLYDAMQKEIEYLESVQGVDFQFEESVKKHRYKVMVNLWWFMLKDLQFKSVCWYCYCWKKSWIEHYLH